MAALAPLLHRAPCRPCRTRDCQRRQHGSISWYDLVWFGFATFLMLNAAGVPPAKAAEEAAQVVAAV